MAILDDIVEQVIEGPLTFDELPIVNPVGVRSLLAEHLGFHPRHFGIGCCPDQKLQALGFALAARPDSDDSEIASLLDTEEELVAHMRQLLKLGLPSWLRRPNSMVQEVSTAIASGQREFFAHEEESWDWDRTRKYLLKSEEFGACFERGRGSARVLPCSCGSTTRLASTIWGPRGLVCFGCGLDAHGVTWDASYRKYLIGAHLLGVDEYVHGQRPKKATGKRRSSKSMRAALATRRGSEQADSA